MRKLFSLTLLLIVLAAASNFTGLKIRGSNSQTDRSPFALELPELNSGKITAPNAYIGRTDINVIKFWIFNPAADAMNWGDIKVNINGKAASMLCQQRPVLDGKMLQCDLSRFTGFKLEPAKNTFEIQAKDKTGKDYYASFVLVTNAKEAMKSQNDSIEENAPPPTNVLRFSGRKYAVIIGVSEYQYTDAGLGNLRFADDDAQSLNDFLTQTNGGGFKKEDILFLTNKEATLNTVCDSLNRFLTRASKTDLVLFFLAGHGTPDPYDPKTLYFLVYDSKIADLKRTALPMLELKQIIETKLRAERAVFFLDTCHSAGVSGTSIVDSERALGLATENNLINDFAAKQLFKQEGRAVLTSSDVSETSRESTKWGGGHGVFTWALLQGLKGEADNNSDKIITAGELFSYVRIKVRQETNQKQNPKAMAGINAALELSVLSN
jgi:hypothetical protein